jgi:hypothetical protein
MITSEVIQSHHLSRQAIIYVRQSSPGQVVNHKESLELQYGLRERPRQSGWDTGSIAVIDTDLAVGLSAGHVYGPRRVAGSLLYRCRDSRRQGRPTILPRRRPPGICFSWP